MPATKLDFQHDVRSHVLVGTEFGVYVGSNTFDQEIDLSLSLVYSDSKTLDDREAPVSDSSRKHALNASAVLNADGSPILTVCGGSQQLARGQGSVRVRISETSKMHRDRPVRIVVRGACKSNEGNTAPTAIEPAVSKSFLVMRYQLDFDVSESSLPGTWYRDGKGRNNFMTASITLKGARSHGDRSRRPSDLPRVPLKFELLYESQQPVANQRILKQRRGSDATTASDADACTAEIIDGRCRFEFRILDVSSKHRKQRFRLRVKPNLAKDPSFSDVAFRDSVRQSLLWSLQQLVVLFTLCDWTLTCSV